METKKTRGRPHGTLRGRKPIITITVSSDNLKWLKGQEGSYASVIEGLINKEKG